MTKEEKHLWYDFLRFHPIKIRRQKVIGKYIVDFYCERAKLVIELDGSGHYNQESRNYDMERTLFLEQYGLTVLRIPNIEIITNFKSVCDRINEHIEKALNN